MNQVIDAEFVAVWYYDKDKGISTEVRSPCSIDIINRRVFNIEEKTVHPDGYLARTFVQWEDEEAFSEVSVIENEEFPGEYKFAWKSEKVYYFR